MSHTQGKMGMEGGVISTLVEGFDDATNKANARRLVACWNALEGVPTEWLENYVFRSVENVIQENAALKAENERLRKAAEELMRVLNEGGNRAKSMQNLRAALDGE